MGHAQKKKIVVKAPYFDKNEEKYPGATILTRDSRRQIYIEHEGIEMWCNKAYHYKDNDSIAAFGEVKIKQGDSITLTSNVANYSGINKLAFTAGNVVLTEPKSTLHTDTLYFDRIREQAYYKSGGVIYHEQNTIKSHIGNYYLDGKKYQFISAVEITSPEYKLTSSQLDFYSNSGLAYMYGKSQIDHTNTRILCERGFYDTNADRGYFVKNSKIFYENRIFEGDSMYFDQGRDFASATNNIKITDTINNSIITGHYGEVYKARDSVFITKRALAKSIQDNDSIYIHADTLMITGKVQKRIIKAFHRAKIFKSDMNGKCDSIYVNQELGITKMIRRPVVWSGENQITGDTIKLFNNPEGQKLDSLLVYPNVFLVEKDSIQGYNQLKGKELIGLFNEENELYNIDINKNAEQIYYARSEDGNLIGIDKKTCSSINVKLVKNQVEEITFLNKPEANTYPESMFPKNARRLRGFLWRGDERMYSIEDMFKDDPPLELPVIRGLEERVIGPTQELRSVAPAKPKPKPKKPKPQKLDKSKLRFKNKLQKKGGKLGRQ